MKPSRKYLEGLASETGFRAGTLEKVLRLGEIVADISRHPFLSAVLALKGGTALNLCFSTPRRLSVDLDFNYVGAEEREKMREDRPAVEQALRQIARGQGYQVQESRDEHAERKFFLNYESFAGTRDRIEVDLNFLARVPILETLEQGLWQPGDVEKPGVRLLSLEEICAGKLCALLDRCAPRDLYDVKAFPDLMGDILAAPRCRSLFIAMAGILAHPVYRYNRNRLERVTDDDVRSQLHPMLSGDDRPSASTLRTEAWHVIAPLLKLTNAEREYQGRPPSRIEPLR